MNETSNSILKSIICSEQDRKMPSTFISLFDNGSKQQLWWDASQQIRGQVAIWCGNSLWDYHLWGGYRVRCEQEAVLPVNSLHHGVDRSRVRRGHGSGIWAAGRWSRWRRSQVSTYLTWLTCALCGQRWASFSYIELRGIISLIWIQHHELELLLLNLPLPWDVFLPIFAVDFLRLSLSLRGEQHFARWLHLTHLGVKRLPAQRCEGRLPSSRGLDWEACLRELLTSWRAWGLTAKGLIWDERVERWYVLVAWQIRVTAASPTRVIVSEADGEGSAVGGQRAVHETVRVQVCQSVALFLDVQIDEFHPGVAVVQLWSQIWGAAEDGCQLPQLPFLWGKENVWSTQQETFRQGSTIWDDITTIFITK